MSRDPASMPVGHTRTTTHPAACPRCNNNTETSHAGSCAAGICRLWLPGRQMTALGMPAPADSTADGTRRPRHFTQQMPTDTELTDVGDVRKIHQTAVRGGAASGYGALKPQTNLLETALGTSAIMQPEASVAPATHNTLLAATSTSTNDDPHPRASPHPHVEQSQPHGPLPDLSKDQLRSYIRSHCVRGGNCSVGSVRFRSALLRGELQAGPHHTDDVRRTFQGRYSSARWWQTHVVFQGHRNGDSMRVHRPWVSLLKVACTPTLPFTSVIQCHIAI